jgi:protein CpxP
MKSGIKTLVLVSMLASAGFATFAQTTAPATDTRPAMASAGTAHGDGMERHDNMVKRGQHMDPAKMEAMVAKRQAEMKTKLKITADQEGAWATFTTAMKPPSDWMDHKRTDRAEMDKLTTPERIDKMHALRVQHMADRSAAMDKRNDATKAFYTVLNADQKKTFDAEHARMGGHRGEHRRGAGGHMGGDNKPPAK